MKPFLNLTPQNKKLAARQNLSSRPSAIGGSIKTLRAWRDHIAPALPCAEFHVIGSGSVDPQGAPRVFFHRQLTKRKMQEVYFGATAMLYPGANDETFRLAAAEAQCSGLPVVTLRLGPSWTPNFRK
jgi:glycosyltransferase involved in cell wall biosynthesis